jgi:hypothetical protein
VSATSKKDADHNKTKENEKVINHLVIPLENPGLIIMAYVIFELSNGERHFYTADLRKLDYDLQHEYCAVTEKFYKEFGLGKWQKDPADPMSLKVTGRVGCGLLYIRETYIGSMQVNHCNFRKPHLDDVLPNVLEAVKRRGKNLKVDILLDNMVGIDHHKQIHFVQVG